MFLTVVFCVFFINPVYDVAIISFSIRFVGGDSMLFGHW